MRLALRTAIVAHPRRIVAGETYFITRRCCHRALRLRPCAETNRIFMYCLAFAMQKTGVVLHAACLMSNHHHLVITDPRGMLPDFLRELHRLVAKAVNASQGQWESLWSAEPCNVVRLVTDGDVDDKIAYVVANPIAAGLVKHPDAWPGFLAWGHRTFRVSRPSAYFSKKSKCPVELALVIAPPGRDDGGASTHERLARIGRFIAQRVTAAHRAIRDKGREFLGPGGVMGVASIRRARSYEERRGVVPTFAAQERSVRDRLRQVERDFRRRYRTALELWRSGVRDVVFPFGTWGMMVFHLIPIELPRAA